MSDWHAISALDDALARTRGLLLPFKSDVWLRLAILATLATGIGSSSQDNIIDSISGSGAESNATFLGLGAFAAFLFITLFLAYLSSIASFAYVKAIAHGSKSIWEDLRRYVDEGLRLFLFEIAMVGALFLFVVLAMVVTLGAISAGPAGIVVIFAVFAIGIPFFFAWTLIVWLVSTFSVPVVYATGSGLLAATGRVLARIRDEPMQFLIFFIVNFCIALAVGLVVALVTFVFIFAAFMILQLLGLGPYVGLEPIKGSMDMSKMALVILGVVLLELLNLVLSFGTNIAFLPLPLFLRVYALSFLSRFDPGLDLFMAGNKSNAGEGKDSQCPHYDSIKVY